MVSSLRDALSLGESFLYQCFIPKGISSEKARLLYVSSLQDVLKLGECFLYQYFIPKGIANTKMREFFPILNY